MARTRPHRPTLAAGWFLSSAHTEDDVSSTLDAMGHALARVAAELGTV